jgi:hypothetical protein
MTSWISKKEKELLAEFKQQEERYIMGIDPIPERKPNIMNKARNRDFKSDILKVHLRRKFRGMTMWDRLKLLQFEYQIAMHKQQIALMEFHKMVDRLPQKENTELFTWSLQKKDPKIEEL